MSRIAVLATGSELLDGRVSDTNTAMIARKLREVGLFISESRCVGDRPEEIAAQLRELAQRHRAVIVTGGLGPTSDDLTAEAAASAFLLPLEEHPEALALIETFFVRSGRTMHESNRKQALLPRGAKPLPNHTGSAPGFTLAQGDCHLYFFPGVPRELEPMLGDVLIPQLCSYLPGEPRQRKTFKVLGIAEAHLQQLLDALPFPAGVAPTFTLSYPLVLVSFEVRGEDAAQILQRCTELVRPCLGPALVAEDHEELVEVVARLLETQGKTLAVAESCTGGLVSKLLTDIPGASNFLERSAVTYANSAKQEWLGVSEQLLASHGAVSEEVAVAMATGMRATARSDLALAITGIAGPGGGTAEKPIGTVYVALASATGCHAMLLQLFGERDQIRHAAAIRALDMLRRELLGLA